MNSRVAEACGSATPLREDLIEDKGNLASAGVGKRIDATSIYDRRVERN
jgi:hypothetical protein